MKRNSAISLLLTLMLCIVAAGNIFTASAQTQTPVPIQTIEPEPRRQEQDEYICLAPCSYDEATGIWDCPCSDPPVTADDTEESAPEWPPQSYLF